MTMMMENKGCNPIVTQLYVIYDINRTNDITEPP
jgi:hypothetical protein